MGIAERMSKHKGKQVNCKIVSPLCFSVKCQEQAPPLQEKNKHSGIALRRRKRVAESSTLTGVPASSVSEDSLLEFSKVSRLLLEVLGK